MHTLDLEINASQISLQDFDTRAAFEFPAAHLRVTLLDEAPETDAPTAKPTAQPTPG